MDWVYPLPKIQIFRFWKYHGEVVSKINWTRLFFNFCIFFAIFEDFSKFHSTFGALWKIIKCVNILIWLKLKKILTIFNLLQTRFHAESPTRNSIMGRPDLSLLYLHHCCVIIIFLEPPIRGRNSPNMCWKMYFNYQSRWKSPITIILYY